MFAKTLHSLAFLLLLLPLTAQEIKCPVNRWNMSNHGAAYIDELGNKTIFGDFANLENSEYINDGHLFLFGDIANKGFIGDGEGEEYIRSCDSTTTIVSGTGVTQFNRLFVDNPYDVNLKAEMRIKTRLQFVHGIIHTDRTNLRYRVTFQPGSSSQGATDKKHINGIVRKQGPGSFTFPTGDGHHLSRINAVGQNNFDLMTASYYSIRMDSALWKLPGTFPVSQRDATVFAVQDKEFWTLASGQSTRVTLYFTNYSEISKITDNINDLIIVGWDGAKWVNLGQTAIQAAFGTGSVTSKSVIPNRYKAFTFGIKDSDADTYVDSKDIEPFNPCVPDPSSEACQNRVCLEVDISVYLEGALRSTGINNYSDQMKTSLWRFGYLPGQKPKTLFGVATEPGQPYTLDPWRHDGSEGENINEFLAATPNNRYPDSIVDWVLVSLRTNIDAESTTCTKSALLTASGKIIFTEFFDCCGLNFTSYYVVIQHRNHLPVMSPKPIAINEGIISYDFRKSQSYTRLLGSGQKEISPGVFAMFAGNGDQATAIESPKDINSNDVSLWARDNGKHSGYYFQDYDLNGDVNVHDKALWLSNNGIFTDVDIR